MFKALALLLFLALASPGSVPVVHAEPIIQIVLADHAIPALGVMNLATAMVGVATVERIALEPLLLSIAQAAEILATSRSEIYQKLARGELEAVKDGSRTKIKFESVKRVADALPKASVFRLYVSKKKSG
jgi:excisionase family DNA binding protein